MNNVIIKEVNGKQLVSARELYEFLEVGTNFTTWFERMCEYGFVEDEDFIPFLEESNGGRPRQDYIINIDMAKELSMLQRSVQGKKARKYFIECEKALSNRNQLSDIDILKLLYREKRVYITT